MQTVALQISIQFLCFVFTYGFLNVQHIHLDGGGAELYLYHIPGLNIYGRLGRPAIDQHPPGIAGLIGHGAPFDQAGNF